MKFDENFAAVHAYLCADGYVITNDKWKYYRTGFRNTNLTLLKDFQKKFEGVFGVKPKLRKNERCEKCSKKIYEELTKKFGSFYSWKWKMPGVNKKLSKIWLRTYFDCEGWVFCKKHQNRHIGVDCVNEMGLNQIEKALNKLGIKTIRKYNEKRKIHRILIYGKENLQEFAKQIGFLHPAKDMKLKTLLSDFVIYRWNFPKDKDGCKKFVNAILKEKIKLKKPYYARIISKEENNLKSLKRYLIIFYNINIRLYKRKNGIGTIYYELNINKREDIKKLINLKIIPNILKSV